MKPFSLIHDLNSSIWWCNVSSRLSGYVMPRHNYDCNLLYFACQYTLIGIQKLVLQSKPEMMASMARAIWTSGISCIFFIWYYYCILSKRYESWNIQSINCNVSFKVVFVQFAEYHNYVSNIVIFDMCFSLMIRERRF